MKVALTVPVAAALLYAGIAVADNTSPSHLLPSELEALESMVPVDMKRFVIHDEARPFRDKMFLNAEGDEIDLHAFDGHLTLVNLWATWCPPCRKELPGMDRLKGALADEGLEIVAISLDRGGLKKAGTFWKRAGFDHLELYADPDKDLAQEMGVISLPVTAIVGPDGREIARMVGDAEWDSDEAQAMLRFLIEKTGVKGSS